MKAKVAIVFFFLLSCYSTLFSQIVQRNAHTVEAYFGVPDWWRSLLRNGLNSNVYSLSTQSVGPWGARYEYMLNRRIGFGADAWYVSTSFTGLYSQPNSSGPPSVISFTGKLSRINVIGRMTVHLSTHEKFDPYVHVGLGYLYSTLHFVSTNKSVYDETNPLPSFTFRAGMGLKYYFSQDFGTFIDVGIGGPLVSFGLFTRWRKVWDQ